MGTHPYNLLVVVLGIVFGSSIFANSLSNQTWVQHTTSPPAHSPLCPLFDFKAAQ
ncbi:hypothetical protein BJX61DRAFT_512141 [Aspergillus egyptiacus]|nr:hypothetical protein BJX61DRAFT_512141 [Aspergillus egyptiacus]